MVAAVAALGTVAAAGIGAAASSSAAGKQSSAANNASAQQLVWDQLNYNNQGAYRGLGNNAADTLNGAFKDYYAYGSPYYDQAANALTGIPGSANLPAAPNLPSQPHQMTQAELEATPGYQFNLSQGLKSTQNAAAARGLGVSGAALKGAANFATGLADNTYQNQFANQQTLYQDALNSAQQNYTNQFQNAQTGYQDQYQSALAQFTNLFNLGNADTANRNAKFQGLTNLATLGENAATNTGAQAIQGQGQLNNLLTSAANSQAAGTVGTANALSGGINNAVNTYQQQQLLNRLFPSTGSSSTTTPNGYIPSTSVYAGGVDGSLPPVY